MEIYRPIPFDLTPVAGWKEIPIFENGEKLVPLGPFSENDVIFTRSIYVGEGYESPYIDQPLSGSLITMFVREGVTQQLRTAQDLLPQGMYLIAFDTYRSLDVQQSLFNKYFGNLKDKNPEWSEEQLLTETQKFVSLPSTDPTRPSPHNTGGAVDVAIYSLPEDADTEVKNLDERIKNSDRNWQEIYILEMRRIALLRNNAQMLDFGTPYDWGGREAALNYLELESEVRELAPDEQLARRNRRILYHVMTQAGFEPYEDEWWHYNFKKSQMGAKTAGLQFAEHGAVVLSPENLAHEEMRKNHRLGSIRMVGRQRGAFQDKLGILPRGFYIAYQAVQETGDLRTSSFPEASIISPS